MTSEAIDACFQHFFAWKMDGREAHRHKVLRATKFIRLGQKLIKVIAVGLLLSLKLAGQIQEHRMADHFNKLVNGPKVRTRRAGIDKVRIAKWWVYACDTWLIRTVLGRELCIRIRVVVQLKQAGVCIRPVINGSSSRVRRHSKNANDLQHWLAFEELTHCVREIEKHPGARATEETPHDVNRDAFRDLQAAAHCCSLARILGDFRIFFFYTARDLLVVPKVGKSSACTNGARSLSDVSA